MSSELFGENRILDVLKANQSLLSIHMVKFKCLSNLASWCKLDDMDDEGKLIDVISCRVDNVVFRMCSPTRS